MNSRRWRLEEVDRFDRRAPTQVRFLRFAVRHTPPGQQDPVSTVGGPTEVRFLRFAVHQTPPDEQDPVPTQPVGSHAFRCLPMNTAHSVAPHEHDAFRCLPMNTTTTLFLRSDPAMYMSPDRTYA